jgi:hypothetical protein
MSEPFAEKVAMRLVVEPTRCAAGMRERDIGHSVLRSHTSDRAFERDVSPEPLDGEATNEEDDTRLQ